MKTFTIILLIVIILIIYFIYQYIQSSRTLTNIMDAKNEFTILAKDLVSTKTSTTNSYSIWMYIDDWTYRNGEKKIVFLRGKLDTNNDPIDPCPSVHLGEYDNDLYVQMTYNDSITSSVKIHHCSVSNIPIQKWVNVTTVVSGRTVDIYLDGKLVNTCLLPGSVHIDNTTDAYITPAGGFSGYTSKFQYYDYALTSKEVWDVYTSGYGGSSYITSLLNTKVNISISNNGVVESAYTI